MNKRFFLSVFIFFLIACNSENNFYTNYAVEDLWRLPLLKPYELRTLQNDSPETRPYWSLNLITSQKQKSYLSQITVSKVNVHDSLIYGFGPFRENNMYFVINAMKREEFLFTDYNEWVVFLGTQNIKINSVENVWDLFYAFKKTGNLPWHKKSKIS